MKMRFLAVCLLMIASTCELVAQDFGTSLQAAIAEEFETILKKWMPLAEQGVPDAQFNVGNM